MPPHRGQIEISIAKTRLSRAAQLNGAVGKFLCKPDSVGIDVAGFLGFFCDGIALSTFGDDQSGIELKKKTAFKNGRKNGLEELFHQDGKLASRIRYKDGVKDGPLEAYWPSGQLYTRVSYIAGKESGLYERFYSNGQLMIRQNYEDGVLHGVFEDFNQNGDLIQTAVYEKGVKIE